MSVKRLGRVCTKSTALFLCDMQEKFRKTIQFYPQILNVSNRMLKAAQALDLPVVVTEQYPKGIICLFACNCMLVGTCVIKFSYSTDL